MSDKNESNQVIVEFIVEFKEKLETIKKYYGIQSNAELVKVLVNEKAQQLNISKIEATTNVN
jgi:hypothetical protein